MGRGMTTVVDYGIHAGLKGQKSGLSGVRTVVVV